MAELWYGHFDSTPEDERLLLASDWARFIAGFVTDGIRNGGTCLQVTTDTGMNVKIDNGVANILGYVMEIKTDLNGRYYSVTVPTANPQYPRIDRLVLRLDRRIQARNIVPVVLLGTAAASPVAPPLTRSSDIWELSLAQIRVNANAINITQANITDERFNTAVCGLMNSVLGLDPSVWKSQFDAFMAGLNTEGNQLIQTFNNQQQAALSANNLLWQTWFSGIKAEPQQYISFNFDNWAALADVSKETIFTSGTQIDEEIRLKANNRLVAARRNTFNSNGSITVKETVYGNDGVTVLRTATNTITFGTRITESIV